MHIRNARGRVFLPRGSTLFCPRLSLDLKKIFQADCKTTYLTITESPDLIGATQR